MCGWAFDTKKFNLNQKIKEKSLNGKVVKTDTLYVLNRK